jgi:hypothetical protein
MRKTKVLCGVCRNDYYNHNRPEGCWSFGQAEVVMAIRVGIWEPPPYGKARALPYLDCCRPDGFALIRVDDCRVTP